MTSFADRVWRLQYLVEYRDEIRKVYVSDGIREAEKAIAKILKKQGVISKSTSTTYFAAEWALNCLLTYGDISKRESKIKKQCFARITKWRSEIKTEEEICGDFKEKYARSLKRGKF